MRSRSLLTALCSLAAAFGFAACSSDDDTTTVPEPGMEGDGAYDFVSARPGSVSSNGLSDGDSAAEGGGAGSGGSANSPGAAPPTDSDDGGADRAIAEADILKRDGDRIYALSRFGGLSVVDASDPRALRLVGNYRTAAEPFEMYVEGTTVFAMLNAYYEYVCAEGGPCNWQATSRVQALDVSDPSAIVRLGDQEVPGTIVDSRRVGDVLYLATLENGYCWGCDNTPNTTITSFDVSELTAFEQIDQLRFPSPQDSYAGQRSIAVTAERIYVSGWDWNASSQSQTGSIQVVDISDPAGDLVAGATIPIAGQIQSRWQMDEHDGVLRVISQPGGWGSSIPPVLETFRVDSAAEVQRLAGIDFVLPRPNEVLQSARFDGDRAYAITFERTDPLFTFDLSDPTNPRQVGELEIPGWVYHMEPRGDRLFALGFDNENDAGSLHVSLFDVSDLDAPTMLSRVPFGGDWGSFAEGQDQIHKAFTILDDSGLILVPFAGGTYDEQSCSYDYGSGIQLVDFTRDTLTKRGVAPQVGSARRALIHRDHLFGIGDNTVQTFDITDRDAPVATARLDVARNVSTVRVLGDHLLRFGSDWWTNQTTLDMTPLERATEAQPQADIDLSALFGDNAWSCNGGTQWTGQVFTKGDYAYVPRVTYKYTNDYREYEQRLSLYVVDLSDRSAPKPTGALEIEPFGGDVSFTGIIQTESTLLVGRSTGYNYYYYYDGSQGSRPEPRHYYDVIDLREPATPEVVHRFEVPEQLASGGFGYYYGMGGCSIDLPWGWWGGGYGGGAALTDGDLVISQHFEPIEGSDDQVRYFMDRIDLSDPRAPVFLPKVNVPGNVVHFDADQGSIVTLDFQTTLEDAGGSDCWSRGAWGGYERNGRCVVQRRTLNGLLLEGERAVRKSQVALDRFERTAGIAISDSRVFYATQPFPSRSASGAAVATTLKSLALAGGSFEPLPEVSLESSYQYYSYGDLRARGERVFMNNQSELVVVDTSDPGAPVQASFELPVYTYCNALEVAGDTAYCALGQRGVEAFDLSTMR